MMACEKRRIGFSYHQYATEDPARFQPSPSCFRPCFTLCIQSSAQRSCRCTNAKGKTCNLLQSRGRVAARRPLESSGLPDSFLLLYCIFIVCMNGDSFATPDVQKRLRRRCAGFAMLGGSVRGPAWALAFPALASQESGATPPRTFAQPAFIAAFLESAFKTSELFPSYLIFSEAFCCALQ
jgi:hypothetical protein